MMPMMRMMRMTRILTAALLAATVCSAAPAQSGAPRPADNLSARDHPLDDGTRIDLTWDLSPDDKPLTDDQVEANASAEPQTIVVKPVSHYKVLRSSELNGKYVAAGQAVIDKWVYQTRVTTFTFEKLERGEDYFFKVVAVGSDGAESAKAGPVGPVRPVRQWFDGHPALTRGGGNPLRVGGRFWMMVIVVTLCGGVIFWINRARKGKPVKVRKIAGLEAVEEAVGRATEMGRSVLFIPGIQDMNEIQTIAGMIVLARVAKTAAEYDAKVEVPTAWALVMATAREIVQAAFLEAGRPEAYNEDLIYYVTNEQFGYVAYLQGMMVREKPAACFYMGSFYAESLILAETGNSIGAIQIAGTAQPAQLPFFVAACDYTLIGEEFFAASAYLSGSPAQLGSLKGQDLGKVVVAIFLLLGVLFVTLATVTGSESFELIANFIKEYVTA